MRTALTIRQPWAWAIVHGYKDVENRSRRTRHRGPLLIHAAQSLDPAGFVFLYQMGLLKKLPEDLPTGALVGQVEVIDCMKRFDSPWAMHGYFQWVLKSPKEFRTPIPCLGHQGLFTPDVSNRSIAAALRFAVSRRSKA